MHARVWAGPATSAAGSVVLLHGIVSSRYLIPTARELAASYRVFAPDMIGFGKTPGRAGSLTIPETADLVAAWMTNAGLSGSIVVGHSIGAQVAADLAARHPAAVRGVVLAAPTVDRSARTVLSQAWRWLANAPAEPASFNALALFEVVEIRPTRMLRALRQALDDAIEDKLPDLRCPVLLVGGERDRLVPSEWLDELRRRRPAAELAVVPEAAHTVVYTHPIALARVIVDFADRIV